MEDVPVAVPLVLNQLIPQERAQQRSVEQVVHAHVPPATVSGRIVVQAVDAPGIRDAPGLAHAQQRTSRAAAAWLGAPQEHSDGVFRTFSPGRNSATIASQSSATLVPRSSSSAPPACGQGTWVDGEVVWVQMESPHGPYWMNLSTQHSQWHPPWEDR